jgi:hypothetical protein
MPSMRPIRSWRVRFALAVPVCVATGLLLWLTGDSGTWLVVGAVTPAVVALVTVWWRPTP